MLKTTAFDTYIIQHFKKENMSTLTINYLISNKKFSRVKVDCYNSVYYK